MAKKFQIDIKTTGAEKARNEVNGLKSSIASTAIAIAAATAAIYAMKKAFDVTVVFKNAARDAEETKNKFLTVFETISNKARSTAQDMAEAFGLASTTAMELLGSTGDLLVGFGFTEEKALEMSQAVNELAIDLASFQNYVGGAAGASAALTKAILGETESAKSLGIVIRQNTKEFKANVRQVMAATGATEQQAKAQIILQQAYKQSNKAVGDFSRTQMQLANQERILEENIKGLKEQIGEAFVPAFLSATKAMNEFSDVLSEDLKDDIAFFGKQLGEIVDVIITSIKFWEKYGDIIMVTLMPAIELTKKAFEAFYWVLKELDKLYGQTDPMLKRYAENYGQYRVYIAKATEATEEFNIALGNMKIGLVGIDNVLSTTFAPKKEKVTFWSLWLGDINEMTDEQLVALQGFYDEFAAEEQRLLNESEARWQAFASTASNILYEAFGGQFQNIEQMFKNMLKRMLADLVVSGLLSLLTGGLAGGTGMFGSGGLLSGLGIFGGGSSPNITVQPTPITILVTPEGISALAESGDIIRGTF